MVVGALVWRCLRQKRREAPARSWLAEYKSAREVSHPRRRLVRVLQLPPAPEWCGSLLNDVKYAKLHIKGQRDLLREMLSVARYEQRVRKWSRVVAELRNTKLTWEHLYRFGNDMLAHLDEGDKAWATTQMERLVQEHVTALLAEARGGNPAAFIEVSQIVGQHGEYHKVFSHKYEYPSDWDELLVRFVMVPMLDQFKNSRTELAAGQIGPLAAEALAGRSLLKAKLVLAFCKKRDWSGDLSRHDYLFRVELGSVLFADIQKLVRALHIELNLPVAALD